MIILIKTLIIIVIVAQLIVVWKPARWHVGRVIIIQTIINNINHSNTKHNNSNK